MTSIPDDLTVAPSVAPDAEPWQQRLEAIALLLTLTAVVSVLARIITAYERSTDSRGYIDAHVDVIGVVRAAALASVPWAAATVVVAFLLVTLGPGDRLSGRGVFVLRSLMVVGLFLAGLAAFGTLAVLFHSTEPGSGSLTQLDPAALTDDFVGRLGWAAPTAMSAAISGYVAWCAFSTLGETPELLFPDGPDEVSPVSPAG